MQARHPEAVDDVVGAQRDQHRTADRHVQLVRRREASARVVRRRSAPPTRTDGATRSMWTASASGSRASARSVEEAREEQHDEQHRRPAMPQATERRERRVLARVRLEVGPASLARARRAPDRDRERGERQREDDRAGDEHHVPQVEQRRRLRAGRREGVVDAVHCGRPVAADGFARLGLSRVAERLRACASGTRRRGSARRRPARGRPSSGRRQRAARSGLRESGRRTPACRSGVLRRCVR